MSTLSINMLSPLAVYLDETSLRSALAPRPSTLDGLTIGLVPNWRPAGIDLLNALGDALKQRFQLKGAVLEPPVLQPPVGKNRLLDGMDEQLDDLARRVDVAIMAVAD